jgi:hypothetical protein
MPSPCRGVSTGFSNCRKELPTVHAAFNSKLPPRCANVSPMKPQFGEGNVLIAFGDFEMKRDNPSLAKQNYEQAEALFHEDGNRLAEVRAESKLAFLEESLGNTNSAEAHAKQFFKGLGDMEIPFVPLSRFTGGSGAFTRNAVAPEETELRANGPKTSSASDAGGTAAHLGRTTTTRASTKSPLAGKLWHGVFL